MSEKTVKALDPRGLFNDVLRAPLAPRPETLDGKTVYIINSWGGDTHGFEGVQKALDEYLRERFPAVRIEYRTRKMYSSDEPALWAEMKENIEKVLKVAGEIEKMAESKVEFSRALGSVKIPRGFDLSL